MGVLGWWLDLMVLEVFSNLNDSMIAQQCAGKEGRYRLLACFQMISNDSDPLNARYLMKAK